MSDKILNSSKIVELSESEDGLYLYLTGQLCYMDEYNLNGIRLLKGDKFQENLNSLIDTPVVAKYVWDENNGEDFAGHEVYEDWFTGQIKFGTEAIGVHQEVSVEDRLVKPVFSDKEVVLPVIMYKAKIWADRFPEFAKVIKKLYSQGELGTSWELIPNSISPEKTEIEAVPNPRSTDDFTFIGNCLLGKDVIGAYEGTSKVVDIASASIENQIAQALQIDIENNKKQSQNQISNSESNERKEDCMEERIKELELQLSEALDKLKAHEDANRETEIETLKSEVETIKSEKSEVEEKLVKATENMESLTSQVEELKPYKEKIDAIEAEKAEAEKAEKIESLKQMATKGGYISEEELESNEELKNIISEADEDALKIFRAERVLAKIDSEKEKEVETSEKKKDEKQRVDFSESTKTSKIVMEDFLK